MASAWLKGIVIQVGADTSPLQKSLKEVDGTSKELQKELTQVNKLLKFDSSNTDLFKQKQDLLSKSVELTTAKLESLKKVKEDMDKKDSFTEEESKRYRELVREISYTEQKLTKLTDTTEEVGESFEKANTNALTFADVLKANVLSDVIVGGLESLANMTKKVADSFVDVVKSGVEYNAQMEQYQVSFKAMIGDEEKALQVLDDIKESASKSPFDVASLVESNQALLTTGETAENTEKIIMSLGDAVAYTGGGNAELKRMAQNLVQIKNVGKASSVDIKQFAYAGINIYGILCDYLGKSVDQIKNMEIGYDDLTKALEKASSEGGLYFGAMERQSNTLSGQLNMLESNWKELTGVIADDTTQAIEGKFLPSLNNMLVAMKTGFEDNGMEGLVQAFNDGIDSMVGELMNPDNIEAFFEGAKTLVNGVLDSISSYGYEGENAELTREAVSGFTQGMISMVKDTIPNFIAVGGDLAKAVIQGFIDGLANSIIGTGVFEDYSGWLQSWSNKLHGVDYGHHFSGGFGDMASGGFNSGGVTLNANFTINNGNGITKDVVSGWATTMADLINEELGGRL